MHQQEAATLEAACFSFRCGASRACIEGPLYPPPRTPPDAGFSRHSGRVTRLRDRDLGRSRTYERVLHSRRTPWQSPGVTVPAG